MKKLNKIVSVPLFLVIIMVFLFLSPKSSLANQQTVDLGTASNFAILQAIQSVIWERLQSTEVVLGISVCILVTLSPDCRIFL